MYLAEIRDYIRVEAGVKGIGEYSVLIDNMINQELRRFTGRSKYFEMQTTETFTISSLPVVNAFSLPVDFQLFDFVTWVRPWDSNFTPLNLTAGKGLMIPAEGDPTYYRRQGSQIFVYPYLGLCLNDQIILGYYKSQILQAETDEFPVPSLEMAVIQRVISRLPSVSTEEKQAAAMEAKATYIDSRSENAGNQ